jgi:gamma-glutamyltranspeptidase/glutathione hydrolase
MIIRLFSVLFISFNVWGQSPYIDYQSPFHPTINKQGMVVSQNIESSNIGIEILNRGGNAIDAAVAVGFSLAITLPRAGNLGGGGFMLIYLKERDEIFAIDYRGQASNNIKLKDIFNVDLPKNYEKADRDIVRHGYKASTVPGTVSGLIEAHKNFGKLPLSEVLKPVISQAKKGIRVSYDLEKAIGSAQQLYKDLESRRKYFRDDMPIKEGSIMKRPDLAKTLISISENGSSGFYEGEIAKKFVEAMESNGGFITSGDLKDYKSRFNIPIGINYRGRKVYTHGPPSGGGIVLLTALNVLENFNLKKYQSNSAATYHLLAESLRRGHNNRSHHVGDPSFYKTPIETFLSSERTKQLARNINFKKASPVSVVKPLSIKNESKDTTHYSIIDDQGNAVSNTYTLGSSFGSGVTIPGTGVLMNNQMNNFAYRYGDESIQGRAASPGNRFQPGKRPMSTMAPTMIFNKNDDLMLITGSPGGSFIPAAILRLVTGIIDFGLNIGEATMLPRLHKDWPYSGLDHESTVSSDILKTLTKLGHRTELTKTMGSTQSIHINNGLNHGYADLRRPNSGVAIQTD